MYVQFQSIQIQKYNYYVLVFIKLVKTINKIMYIDIYVNYIFCCL